jgi:glycerol-3-phosphate acyltransferase PlsY
MSVTWWLIALVLPAYLMGSVPFGLIVGRLRGVDVRSAGSGNIGATNVARVLGGKRWFFLVFALDVLKGLLPMLAASALVHRTPESSRTALVYFLWLAVGFAAVLGHMYSLFLRFTGGKGVATSTGVVLGLVPYLLYPGLLALAVFMVAFGATRYISVGSIAGALVFPLAYLAIGALLGWDVAGRQLPLLIMSVLMCAMIIYKHRGNIARLRAGTEHRIGQRPAV